MTDYLSVAEVIAIHADLIARYGGEGGLRDPGLLEAALFRPQTGYYPDLIAETAALWESLSQNHAFLDGNKRVAFAAAYAFLKLNGTTITADADTTHAFLSGLYENNTFTFAALDRWLRANTAAAPTDNPFATFSEWDSDADGRNYSDL